ncbi:uncharacterized protein BDV17DRAFT_293251 [Aspergillus undulatus]|uniref:uncharacterized protein n=1 Tax=Aspergillus undulatus TaxID=1810928 RepID=UPI003CCDE368
MEVTATSLLTARFPQLEKALEDLRVEPREKGEDGINVILTKNDISTARSLRGQTRGQQEAYYELVPTPGTALPIAIMGDSCIVELGFSNWDQGWPAQISLCADAKVWRWIA